MTRRGIVRLVYLLTLASFASWFGTQWIGGWMYFRADGIVVGDPAAVSPEYTATVREVFVKEGQRINRGDPVAQVTSTRVAEIQARLTIQASASTTRLAEVSSRRNMIDSLLASATLREKVATEGNEQLDIVHQKGLLPILTRTAASEQAFKGKQDLETLKAEKSAIEEQVANAIEASRQIDKALFDLHQLFNSGKMRAHVDGTVSMVKVGPGSVVREGDPIVEMVGDQRYVLAYFPTARWYALEAGREVTINPGALRGRITNVSGVAGQVPKEFQRTLAPVERQQLVRIDFDEGQNLPPYFTKVVVR